MNKEEHYAWLKERQTGLGGSDIATIFNKSTFKKDKLGVYLSKVKEITLEDIKEPEGYAKTGIDLEESTLKDYERIKEVKVIRGGYDITRHPDYPFLIASLDGFDKETNTVVEVKVVTHKAKQDMWLNEKGEYNIPTEYLLQVAHYCNVVNADKADVIVRFMPSNKEVILTYDRDRKLEAVIQKGAIAFWNKYVVPKVEPPITAESYETALSCFGIGEETEQKVKTPLELQTLIKEVVTNQQKIKELESDVKEKKARILQYCKDNSTYHLYNEEENSRLVSIIKCKGRSTFDTKRFKEENEKQYKEYTREGYPYNILKLNTGE